MSKILRRILLAELTPRIPQQKIFSTWDPISASSLTLSSGNLQASGPGRYTTDGSVSGARANIFHSAGIHYWETTVTFEGNADFHVGIQGVGAATNDPLGYNRPVGDNPMSFGIKKTGNSVQGGVKTVGAISTGTVLRHLLNLDTKSYSIAKGAGLWVQFLSGAELLYDNGSPPPVGVPEIYPATRLIGGVDPGAPGGVSGEFSNVLANFGETAFVYDVPDGANAGFYTQPDSAVKIFLGSEGFDAVIGGIPVHFMGRIAKGQDVEIEREGSCWVWGGQTVSSRGQLVVVNNDNKLDGWRDYIWRDASVLLKSGYEGQDYAEFTPWAFSRADKIELTRDARIIISLADPLAWLDRPLQKNSYPADQANLQLAGKPIPIVYGSPFFCTPAQLSTVPSVRNYQLTDNNGFGAIDQIDKVYDSGDLFNGPDDTFVPHLAVTGLNGGGFSGNSGATPAIPNFFVAPSIYGTWDLNFNYFKCSGGSLKCICKQAQQLVMEHNAGQPLRARTMYKITFYAGGITTPGTLVFRVPGSPDVSHTFVPFGSGNKTLFLYVKEAGNLQLVMQGDGIDVFISTLRVEAFQVIDWTYFDGTKGFTLANKPYGKIVANVQSELNGLDAFVSDVCERVELPDIDIDGTVLPGYDDTTAISLQGLDSQYAIDEYVSDPITGLAFIRKVLDSWCGFASPNRLGQLCLRKVREPSNTPQIILGKQNIIGEIVVSTDEAKGLTLRLAGRKNNTVHTIAEIATSVPLDLSTQLQSEWGFVVEGGSQANVPVSSVYSASIAGISKATSIRNKDDLQAQANSVATLWRPQRNFYKLTAILSAVDADMLEPMDTALVVWPRWGLDAGKNLLVVGIRTRFFSRRVELKLWG